MKKNPFQNRSVKLQRNRPDPDYLFSATLKFLSFRPRSRQEIQKYLLSKTDDSLQSQSILERLEKVGFLNDHEFAVWLVASRSRTRPRGVYLLKKELLSFGISPEIISEVLASQNDVVLAEKLLSRKLSLWSRLSHMQFHTKAYRLLSQRGFSPSVIETAIRKAYNNPDVSW
jgi:regulatory protein